jgi:hypothetical protein
MPSSGFPSSDGGCDVPISRVAVVPVALLLATAMTLLPVEVAGTQTPSTFIGIPSNNATVSGTSQILDAGASSGVTQVQYEISGGTLTDSVIATATPTIYGWLAKWNTTTVANGTYTLQSVASSNGVSGTSAPVTISVNNPPPSTEVIIPANGATESSMNNIVFDAAASPGVTSVVFNVTGSGEGGISFTVSATPTIYGWIGVYPGQPVNPVGCELQNPFCSVQSLATYAGGVRGTSSPVSFTLDIYLPPSLCGL